MKLPKITFRATFRSVTLVALFGIVGGLLAVTTVFFSLLKGLPDVSSLKAFRHSHATQVYSTDKKLIAEFTTERRYPVDFDKIPKHVIHAFLAAEDSGFYRHKGIDFTGIARAVVSNVLRGHYAQGGSTITQQVARALLLNSKKKEITRKVREMVLAWRMERELTKNDILNLYLSEIYLGHGAFGIGAAAHNYFGKKVEDLTIAEGALVAGLPQRPNDWNPFHNPHLAKRRQQYVLKRMVEENFIEPKQASEAFGEILKLKTTKDLNLTEAPFFTEVVRQYLMGKYGSERVLTEGLRVETTLNYAYQKQAEASMMKGLREVDKRLGWRGAIKNLDGAQTNEFLAAQHKDILNKVVTTRLLPATFDDKAEKKELIYDLSTIQGTDSPYYGPTPLKEGELYQTLMTDLDTTKNTAKAWIGQTQATLSAPGYEWVKFDGKAPKNIGDVMKNGDVVWTRVEKIDRKTGQITVTLEQEPEIQGALLSFDHATGDVAAMFGGTDFEKNKFNCALQAKRQVGSTFKPVLYAAAMDKGFSPASIVTDAPIVFKFEGGLDADNAGEDWRPHNYAGSFEGDIPLRLALIRSMNIPTVKLLNEITVDYGIEYARRMGVTSPLPRDLSIGLGSWSSSLDELTRTFSVFARQGKPIALRYIKKVMDEEGKVIEEIAADVTPAPTPAKVAAQAGVGNAPSNTPAASTVAIDQTLAPGEVISPQTAYVMTDMLKGVVREGTGRAAMNGVGVPVAGKTGTSNDHLDAWFIGYTPHVTTGVWIGYLKNKPLAPGETGGKAAAPIFAEYMSRVSRDYPKNDFAVPDDIVFAYIDKQTGKLATTNSSSRVRVAFKNGMVPNSRGDNLARVGEPGTTRAAAATTMDPNPATRFPEDTPKEEDTDDYLRQGYQE